MGLGNPTSNRTFKQRDHSGVGCDERGVREDCEETRG